MNFTEFSSKHLPMIEEGLRAFLSKEQGEFYSYIVEYTLNSGKRLRPLAVILAYLSCGGKDLNKINLPAISVELDHTHSLILDDMMDEDDYRRGKPSVHYMVKDYYRKYFRDAVYEGSLFNKKSSRFSASYASMLANITWILARKAMLSSGFSNDNIVKALALMEQTDKDIYGGQMLDMLYEHKDIAEAEYLEMIRLKTSVLFGMAFGLGSMLAGTDEHRQMLFREFGIDSAVSFQIQDDILDLTTGKGHELGSDIRKGKKTLIMIKAMERADINQRKIINKIFGDPSAGPEAIERIIRIMHDTGAIDYARRIAMKKNESAKQILKNTIVDPLYMEVLYGFTDFMLEREK